VTFKIAPTMLSVKPQFHRKATILTKKIMKFSKGIYGVNEISLGIERIILANRPAVS
jgi:hypothetical protein